MPDDIAEVKQMTGAMNELSGSLDNVINKFSALEDLSQTPLRGPAGIGNMSSQWQKELTLQGLGTSPQDAEAAYRELISDYKTSDTVFKQLNTTTSQFVTAMEQTIAELQGSTAGIKYISGAPGGPTVTPGFEKAEAIYLSSPKGMADAEKQMQQWFRQYNALPASWMGSATTPTGYSPDLYTGVNMNATGMGETNQGILAAFGADKIQTTVDAEKAVVQQNILLRDSLGLTNTEAQKAGISMGAFGDNVGKTTPPVKSLGDQLIKNVGSFAMWSVALSAVYLPMMKLQEGMQVMISEQAQLAQLSISLGNSTRDLYSVFKDASTVANQLGVTIDSVVSSYSEAYQATGQIADINERTAVTNKLLSDSMLLAKLSGMSETTSLDDLIATLEQQNMGLGQGTDILDKWIRTTQVAAVNMNQLVSTFALIGDSATSAGMSIDEINALVAVTAEKTNYNGNQIATFLQATIGALNKPAVQNLLKAGGIDINAPEYQDTFKLLEAIPQKIAPGTKAFDDLAYAIGGIRRNSPVSALLTGMGEANKVAAESANAHGQAEDALNKLLNTVQTSLTRLDTSFKSLATTMGMKGGILDSVKMLADALTLVLNGLTDVTAATGSLLPQMAALGIASLALSQEKVAATLSQIGLTAVGQGTPWTGIPGFGGTGSKMTQADIIPVIAGLMTATNILGPLAQGNKTQSAEAAGGALAGGFIGAIVGGPAGALLGSAIGSSVVPAIANALKEDNSISGIVYDLWKENTAKGTADGIAEGMTNAQLKTGIIEKIGQAALGPTIGPIAPEWTKYISGKGLITATQGALAAEGKPSDETSAMLFLLQARMDVLSKNTDAASKTQLEELTKFYDLLLGKSWGVGAAGEKGTGIKEGTRNLPDILSVVSQPTLTDKQMQQAIVKANQDLTAELEADGYTQDEANRYIQALNDVLVETKDGISKSVDKFGTTFDPAHLAKAISELQTSGQLSQFKMANIPLDSSQMGLYQQLAEKAKAIVEKELVPLGYQPNYNDTTAVMFKDLVATPAHLDAVQQQILLQLIANINQKQLDGMYNLPEGATFWVPLGAAGIRPTAGGGDVTVGANILAEAARGFAASATEFASAVNIFSTGGPGGESIPKRSLPKTGYRRAPEEGSREYKDSTLYVYRNGQWVPDTGGGISGYLSGPGGESVPSSYYFQDYWNNQLNFAGKATNFGKGAGLQSPIKYTGEGTRESIGPGAIMAIVSNAKNATIDTSPVIKFSLEIKDNITLQVDGRQLANVVKQYLWNDLLRAEASGLTSVARKVTVS